MRRQALAERAADDVGDDDAKPAVREVHGDIESGAETEPRSQDELASAADAEAVRDRSPD